MTIVLFLAKTGYNINEAVDIFAKACFTSGLQVQSCFTEGLQEFGADFSGYVKAEKTPIISRDFPDKADFVVSIGRDKEAMKAAGEGIIITTSKDAKKSKKLYPVESREPAFICGSLAKATGLTSLKNLKKVSDIKGFEEGFKAIR